MFFPKVCHNEYSFGTVGAVVGGAQMSAKQGQW